MDLFLDTCVIISYHIPCHPHNKIVSKFYNNNHINSQTTCKKVEREVNNKLKEILEEFKEYLSNKNRKKDKLMLQQNRLAQMGEMISMIAHQWRQPLSAISSTASAISLKAELNKLDNDKAIELSDKICNFSQHLSSTIDDFRGFAKDDKTKTKTDFETIYNLF